MDNFKEESFLIISSVLFCAFFEKTEGDVLLALSLFLSEEGFAAEALTEELGEEDSV